jgi:glucose-6-phosphate 1-dehydrogenase
VNPEFHINYALSPKPFRFRFKNKFCAHLWSNAVVSEIHSFVICETDCLEGVKFFDFKGKLIHEIGNCDSGP